MNKGWSCVQRRLAARKSWGVENQEAVATAKPTSKKASNCRKSECEKCGAHAVEKIKRKISAHLRRVYREFQAPSSWPRRPRDNSGKHKPSHAQLMWSRNRSAQGKGVEKKNMVSCLCLNRIWQKQQLSRVFGWWFC